MALTIQSILQQHAGSYFARHRWPLHVHRAAQAMQDCRTAALGGHVERCPHGHVVRVHYNSCHHRSCPACNSLPSERWLARRKAQLLPSDHRHVVFTVPQELNVFWRYNRAVFSGILFSAVHDTLLELLEDKKYQGATPGILAALHTWGQLLQIHLHVHVLVTAGGLDDAGKWRKAKKKCLLPRRVVMHLYRGKLRAKLRRAAERDELVLPEGWSRARFFGLLNKLGRTDWNVKILEPYPHGEGVATYLARYARGGPFKNQRLIDLQGQQVRFRYRDNRDRDERTGQGRAKVAQMSVDEFLSRLFEHIPPPRLQTVRAWGLYASSKQDNLATARQALGHSPAEPVKEIGLREFLLEAGYPDPTRCPVCQAELVITQVFVRGRAPPPQSTEKIA
jgi:hypothetical protein